MAVNTKRKRCDGTISARQTFVANLAERLVRFNVVIDGSSIVDDGRDGYAAAERRVTLSASKPSQSLSVPLAREPRGRKTELVSPKPTAQPSAKAEAASLGALVIESRPPGATVLIDGRPVGTTPMSLGDVRVGNHTVRIERDGYRIWTASVKIAAGEQNRVTASLEK